MDTDPVARLLQRSSLRRAPITWGVTPQGYDKIRHDWLAHVSAEEVLTFYRTFTTVFSDTQWTPQAVVVGPQGVLDVVTMTGTLR
jgi:hypothetical protein